MFIAELSQGLQLYIINKLDLGSVSLEREPVWTSIRG